MTSPDPDETAKIANEIALTFQSSVVEIMNIENVQIISEAVPDPDPVSPHVVNNLLIGLGVGFIRVRCCNAALRDGEDDR